MDELKFLKQEENLCREMWENAHEETFLKGKKYTALNHVHICDFDLINLLYYQYGKNRALLRKDAEFKCKQYLKSIGKKRDYNMDCCDHCIHDRYVTISDDNSTVMNICTLGINKRLKDEKC